MAELECREDPGLVMDRFFDFEPAKLEEVPQRPAGDILHAMVEALVWRPRFASVRIT